MSDTATVQTQSTEEVLAAVQAALAMAAPAAKPQAFACPVDPAERAMCEGCQ